jgi:hypothetical protein
VTREKDTNSFITSLDTPTQSVRFNPIGYSAPRRPSHSRRALLRQGLATGDTFPPRRSSNANSLCGQNLAGFPGI